MLTTGAVEAGWTDTLEAAMRVLASAFVLARRPFALTALVDVLLAEAPGEAGRAPARKLAHRQPVGLAGGAILTRVLHTRIRFLAFQACRGYKGPESVHFLFCFFLFNQTFRLLPPRTNLVVGQ